MSWIRRAPTWAVDVAEALLIGTVWFSVIHLATQSYWHPRWLDGYISAGLWLVGAVALRRTATTWAFWVTVCTYPLAQTLGLFSYFQLLPLMVMAFTMARTGRLPAPVVALIAGVSTAALVTAVGRGLNPDLAFLVHHASPSVYLAAEALVVGSIVIGTTFHRLEMTSRSLQERNEELNSLQEALARQAVVDERARIARELHDVVAHHVSAIVVRAQAADRVADRQPHAPREAVRWIAGEGKSALAAMRSVVHVLRADVGPEWAPTATSGAVVLALRDVADRIRATGRTVEMTLPDDVGSLSAETSLALLRIVQEALTNFLLHSQASRVVVHVIGRPDRVTIDVRDEGPATRLPGGGHGLAHMRERAQSCGGTVSAGPDGPGWTVQADLPRGI